MARLATVLLPYNLRLFFFSCFFFFLAYFHFPDSGQAVVTGVIPSPPRFLPSIFIAHRVQQSHCSSIVHRVLLTHALALFASQFVHKKKSQRIYTSMHSAGLELTKLTYTRLEDNLIRHRGVRSLLLPESSEIITPHGSQLKPHVTKVKSYFRHMHPGLQSFVPSLSPLLVRFLRVRLQVDSFRLLVTTAACQHQSCLTQSSSKR